MKITTLSIGRYAVTAKTEVDDSAKGVIMKVDDLAIFRENYLKLSDTVDTDESWSIDSMAPAQLDVPFEGVETLDIDPGLVVIMAPTKWGKTYFTGRGMVPAALSRYNAAEVRAINFVEPLERVPSIEQQLISNPETLLIEILRFLHSDEKVLFVDSLRAFVYDQSVGGTGEGGFDQYIPAQLTALSNVVARFGKLLVVTLNPMISMDNMARYERIVDMIVASVPTAIIGMQRQQAQVHLRGVVTPERSADNVIVRDLSDRALGPILPAIDIVRKGVIDTDIQDAVVPNSAAFRIVQASIAVSDTKGNPDIMTNLYSEE